MKKKNKTLGRGQNKCARKHTKSRIEIEYELDTESIVLVIGSNLGIFFTILLIFFSSIWFDKYWTGYANGKEDMWLFQADNSWKSNHFKIKLIEYAVNGNGQAATHQYLMTASQFSHTQKIYISILLNLLFYAQTNDMFSFNSFDLLFVALLHEDTTKDHLCYNLYPNNNCALAYNPCSFRSFYT